MRIAELVTKVKAQQSVKASVRTLLTGVTEKLKEGASAKAVATELEANAEELVEAVPENTDAADEEDTGEPA
jgi:hypothetical protein